MARISIRDLPDELHQQLMDIAAVNQRSLEGEIRFALGMYVQSLNKQPVAKPSLRETWQRQTGRRLQSLLERLREDDVFGWYERSDWPHIARSLGEESPAPLMDYVEGQLAMPFKMAERIADRFSCRMDWLISGTGSMFEYSEMDMDYRNFFAPAIENRSIEIKMVRICSPEQENGSPGRHDGSLLMFRIDPKSTKIAAGYCFTRFCLGSGMGGVGHGNLEQFVKFLNENPDVSYQAYNFIGDLDPAAKWDHHPRYYLKKCETAYWLKPLMSGRSPGGIDWLDR